MISLDIPSLLLFLVVLHKHTLSYTHTRQGCTHKRQGRCRLGCSCYRAHPKDSNKRALYGTLPCTYVMCRGCSFFTKRFDRFFSCVGTFDSPRPLLRNFFVYASFGLQLPNELTTHTLLFRHLFFIGWPFELSKLGHS